MPDLGWVTMGLTIAYGSMAAYLVSLDLRRRRAQRRKDTA